MFRLVMNPKMKNRAVTMMNGTKYPGEVRAAGFVELVAIRFISRFLEEFAQFGLLMRTGQGTYPGQRRWLPPLGLNPNLFTVAPESRHFAGHNTIRKAPRWGRVERKRLSIRRLSLSMRTIFFSRICAGRLAAESARNTVFSYQREET
jgi:hypothetical protein